MNIHLRWSNRIAAPEPSEPGRDVIPVAPQLSLYGGGGGVDAEISPAAARAVDTDRASLSEY